jgi:hypothetical protein
MRRSTSPATAAKSKTFIGSTTNARTTGVDGKEEGFHVNPVFMDSYVGSHVEPLDKLSSFFAAGKVVCKSCNALFWQFSRAEIIVRKTHCFSWTSRPVDFIAENSQGPCMGG